MSNKSTSRDDDNNNNIKEVENISTNLDTIYSKDEQYGIKIIGKEVNFINDVVIKTINRINGADRYNKVSSL